jgi:hypothetical protein
MKNNFDQLMTVVSDNGTGDDIRNLAMLIKQASNNDLMHIRITQIKHLDGENIYDCVGFNPNDVFNELARIERDNTGFTMETHFIEAFLKDQELTERMAILANLLIKKMPIEMIGYFLGGR